MTTAREDVAAWLRTHTDLRVIEVLAAIENAPEAVAMVARTSITPTSYPDQRDDGLTIWLLSPYMEPVQAEADLDANVDKVTNAIDDHPFLHWESGERDVYADSFHAFRILVTHRTLTKE